MKNLPGIPLAIVLATLAMLAQAAPPPAVAPSAARPVQQPTGRIELPPRPSSGVAPAVLSPAPVAAPAVAASAPLAAAPLVDACPAQLPVRQMVTQDFAGWTPVNEQASYPFARVALYPGPPAESARIVPTTEFNTRAGMHDAWDLPRRPTGYWVACSYGNTTATLARKLPDNVDFCQADYDGRFMTLVVKRWSCGDKRVLPPSLAPTRPVARAATRAAAPRPPVKAASKPTYKHGE